MALVEGVGDEVTALAALAAAVGLLGLAWFSTRTGERGEAALPEADGAPARPGRQEEEEREEDRDRDRDQEGPAGSPFVLRLKFLNETERLARVRPGDTVGALKRLHFPGQEQLVRLIYQGRLLRDDAQTWAALQLRPDSVVHCHVAARRRSAPSSGPEASSSSSSSPPPPSRAALDVGSLTMPLLVVMLAALWYFQLQHRHLFTATATTCLAGLTLLFTFVAFAVYRR